MQNVLYKTALYLLFQNMVAKSKGTESGTLCPVVGLGICVVNHLAP
jgi:hypothetical protein